MSDALTWVDRFGDARGRRVLFVAHCLLNENTRYLGGACRPGAIPEIVEPCLRAGIGLVQLPCPEQMAWGGVQKRRLLRLYGSRSRFGALVRRALLPLMLWYTRVLYTRLAADAANQIQDYCDAKYRVVGVVGVDGSPSCGVCRTLDMRQALHGLSRLQPSTGTSSEVNAIVRNAVCAGPGLFTRLLRRAIADRGLQIPFEAHDLVRELDGVPLGDPVASLIQQASVPS